jgi:hypothetical protein
MAPAIDHDERHHKAVTSLSADKFLRWASCSHARASGGDGADGLSARTRDAA